MTGIYIYIVVYISEYNIHVTMSMLTYISDSIEEDDEDNYSSIYRRISIEDSIADRLKSVMEIISKLLILPHVEAVSFSVLTVFMKFYKIQVWLQYYLVVHRL
jgi:hypothetical protein